MERPPQTSSRGRNLIYLALVIPFIGTLWVSAYNQATPDFNGIPFFYWYMFLWVIISAVITGVVYAFDRK